MDHALVDKDKIPRLEEDSLTKINNILRELLDNRQSKVTVNLLGTH